MLIKLKFFLCCNLISVLGLHYKTHIIERRTLKSDRRIEENQVTFGELIGKSALFVDKSLLIQEIVESPSKIIIISFPPKRGKSINLHMLKLFLEIDQQTRNVSVSRKIFEGSEAIYFDKKKPVSGYLKSPLQITKNRTFMKRHFGKYPVVYVNFTNLVSKFFKDELKMTLKRMKATISKAFRSYPQVYQALREKARCAITTEEKTLAEDIYQKYRSFYLNERSDMTSIKSALRFLIKVVSDHYGRKVYVIFEEFDAPIIDMYKKEHYDNPDAKDIVLVYKGMIHRTFVGNNRIKKGILSGVYNLRELDLTDDGEITEWHNSIYSPLAPYYGFTRSDVIEIAEIIKFDFIHFQEGFSWLDEGWKWFEGYVIPPYNETMFNSAVMADFLNSGMVGGKFCSHDNLIGVINLIQHRFLFDVVLSLINRDNVTMDLEVFNKFGSDDLAYLQCLNYEEEPDEEREENVDRYLAYLMYNGFLSLTPEQLPLPKDATHAFVKFPNNQVLMKFSKHACLYLEEICIDNFRPMEQARRHFQGFMMTKSKKRCQKQFGVSMLNLLKNLPKKSRSGSKNEQYEKFLDYSHMLMEVLALEVQVLMDWKIKIYTNNKLNAEFVIFHPETRHAVITELTFDERNAESALRLAKGKVKVLDRFGPLKTMKFIGINFLSKERLVNTSSEYVELEVPNAKPVKVLDDGNETFSESISSGGDSVYGSISVEIDSDGKVLNKPSVKPDLDAPVQEGEVYWAANKRR